MCIHILFAHLILCLCSAVQFLLFLCSLLCVHQLSIVLLFVWIQFNCSQSFHSWFVLCLYIFIRWLSAVRVFSFVSCLLLLLTILYNHTYNLNKSLSTVWNYLFHWLTLFCIKELESICLYRHRNLCQLIAEWNQTGYV